MPQARLGHWQVPLLTRTSPYLGTTIEKFLYTGGGMALLRQRGALTAVPPPRSSRRVRAALQADAPWRDGCCAGAVKRGSGGAAAAQRSLRVCSSSS